MYNNKKEPFIGLEVYLNETGKKPPKFEYQASSKTAYRDTFTKKKYFISQFGNWLNLVLLMLKVMRCQIMEMPQSNENSYIIL